MKYHLPPVKFPVCFSALIAEPGRVISQFIMAKHCEKCGAEIGEGWTVCRSCYEPVKREGFLSRFRIAWGLAPAVRWVWISTFARPDRADNLDGVAGLRSNPLKFQH
jgi:predicted nucleic acid-binding Zn ribbon protein